MNLEQIDTSTTAGKADKQKAYRAVRTAVETGALTRPSVCERCGLDPGTRRDGRSLIQGHHHDYSKPLDVEWICQKCHRLETPLALGENNGQARLNKEKVLLAKSLRAKGVSYSKIADAVGVSKWTAARAIKGIHWSGVCGSKEVSNVND